jgi:hypothetical protein
MNELETHTPDGAMARKNINRGFKKLTVWNDAVDLYVLACKIFRRFPLDLKKVASNSIDAAHRFRETFRRGTAVAA